MKYRFLADYRHRWPSRAHTEYKAGMVMTLKREVIVAAGDRIEPVRASGGSVTAKLDGLTTGVKPGTPASAIAAGDTPGLVSGARVDAPLAMMGNGDPEVIMPLVDRVITGTAPTPSKRRKLRITDGK